MKDNSQLSPRFDQAFLFARQLHAGQVRKGTSIPYVSHLLGVASIVLENGGTENEAIAALLHDAVEDQGGVKTLDEIRSRFGEQVAEIVVGCTDAYTQPKPPWRERKEKYVEHLWDTSLSVRRVSLADKVHNARSLLADLRLEGPATWNRFRGGQDGTLWYYRSLAEVFLQLGPRPLAEELDRIVTELERLSQSPGSPNTE